MMTINKSEICNYLYIAIKINILAAIIYLLMTLFIGYFVYPIIFFAIINFAIGIGIAYIIWLE